MREDSQRNDGERRRMLTSAIQTRVIDFQRNKERVVRSRTYTALIGENPRRMNFASSHFYKRSRMHCDKRGYGRTRATYNAILSTERYGYVKYEGARKRNHNMITEELLLHFCAKKRIENSYLPNMFDE